MVSVNNAVQSAQDPGVVVYDGSREDLRGKIVKLVKDYVNSSGANYGMTWIRLFRALECYSRQDIIGRAKDKDVKVLDLVAEMGLLNEAYKLAQDILTGRKNGFKRT